MSEELQVISELIGNMRVLLDDLEARVAVLRSGPKPAELKPATKRTTVSSPFKAAPKKNFHHDHVLGFGKYRGRTLGSLLLVDRGYLEWLNENHETYQGHLRGMLDSSSPPDMSSNVPVRTTRVAQKHEPDSDPYNGYDVDDDIPF